MSGATVPVTGWYLENTEGGHMKQYTVLLSDDGVVVHAWGRIGTAGQARVARLPQTDAKAQAMKQVYSKQSTGYKLLTADLKFAVSQTLLDDCVRRTNTRPLIHAFMQASRDPEFQGQKQVVLKHYDDFLTKAQDLMGDAGGLDIDAVFKQFQDLEEAWREINDKHQEAEVTLGLTRAILTQRLTEQSPR